MEDKISKKDFEAPAFIKFQGSSVNRITLDTPTIDVIKCDGCHRYVGYSKHPRNVQNDDVIFISRLTRGPNDIHIYGYAIGMAHREGQDEATQADIDLRPWKRKYRQYIRLNDARFVAGSIENGVSLYELMGTLEADSFATTQYNAAVGEGNTDPRRSVREQPSVRLSPDGFEWLKKRLEVAFNTHGTIAQSMLDQID